MTKQIDNAELVSFLKQNSNRPMQFIYHPQPPTCYDGRVWVEIALPCQDEYSAGLGGTMTATEFTAAFGWNPL